MRLYRFVSLVILLLASATAHADHENNIGLYTTPTPDMTLPVDSEQARLVAPTIGNYEIHLVCSNPVNLNTGTPIQQFGGCDLALSFPPSWIYSITYPPNVINFAAGDEGLGQRLVGPGDDVVPGAHGLGTYGQAVLPGLHESLLGAGQMHAREVDGLGWAATNQRRVGGPAAQVPGLGMP